MKRAEPVKLLFILFFSLTKFLNSIFCALLISQFLVFAALAEDKQTAISIQDVFHIKISAASPESLEIKISNSLKNVPEYSVSTINDPARIVVDIKPTISALKNATYPLKENPADVRQIRLGVHKEKTRLVFDLVSKVAPKIEWKVESGTLQISSTQISKKAPAASGEPTTNKISEPSQVPPEEHPISATPTPHLASSIPLHSSASSHSIAAVSASASNTPYPLPSAAPQSPHPSLLPSAIPVITPQPTAVEDPTPPVLPSVEPQIEKKSPMPSPAPFPTLLPSAIPETMPPAASPPLVSPQPLSITGDENGDKQYLIKVEFVTAGPGQKSYARLSFKKRPQFRLVRKDDRTFILSVSECSIGGRHLLLPIFPPQDVGGINYLQPESKDGSCAISLGLERGLRLEAIAEGNNINLQAPAR